MSATPIAKKAKLLYEAAIENCTRIKSFSTVEDCEWEDLEESRISAEKTTPSACDSDDSTFEKLFLKQNQIEAECVEDIEVPRPPKRRNCDTNLNKYTTFI